MRTVLIFSILFLFSTCILAQTTETEPNDNINDSGVITITANGTYTGSVSSAPSPLNHDYWKFTAGTSALDLKFTGTAPEIYFYLYRYADAAYTTYEASVGMWLGGSNPSLLALDAAKYYALFIVGPEVFGTDNYTFYVEGESSLPAELLTFRARIKTEGILLEWTTESEVNNLGFILDRSLNGIDWTTIASYQTDNTLQSHGNTVNRTHYTFTDNTTQSGQAYYYCLADVSAEGTITQHAPLFVSAEQVPDATAMAQAYPNPFNPQTHIAYQLAQETDVNISVFDMLGRQVKTLYNGHQYEGAYNVYWNGTDESGRHTSTGNYIIKMQTENITQTQKVMFVK